MMIRSLKVTIFLLLAGFSVNSALAQLPTANILGVVKDPSGAVVSGAKVTAKSLETDETKTVVTTQSGDYRISQLAVGKYEIRVEQQGFRPAVETGVSLTVGQDQHMDFVLTLGSTTEAVTVTTDAPSVNISSGSLGGTVDETKMAELPLNGRDYIQLALLQSGINEAKSRTPSSNALAGAGQWFSTNGAPVRSNAYLLDGTNLATYGGSSSSTISGNTLGLDGIREFRIITNSADAQYGGVMGAQMTMVSRSGTNKYHGSVFDYLRNSALDAKNYFDNPQGSGLTVAGAQRRLPPFRRNNFGAAVGGYIHKEKTFFHVNYEGLRQVQGLTFLNNTLPAGCHGPAGAVITPAQCSAVTSNTTIDARTAPWVALFPLPNNGTNGLSWSFQQPVHDDFGQARVDHTFSQKDNIFVRYTVNRSDLAIPGTYPGYDYQSNGKNQYLTAAENHTFSANVLNSFRFGFSRAPQTIGLKNYVTGPGYSFETGFPMGTLAVGGTTQALFGGNPTSQAFQDVLSFSDDVFLNKGRHSIKVGVLINHYNINVSNGTNLFGRINFSNISNFLKAIPTTYQAVAPGGTNQKEVSFYSIGEYFQDDWKVSSRLTLNLGLRYEINTDIHAVGDTASFNGALINPLTDTDFTHTSLLTRNPSYKNFGPRVGFAYDVFGNGKTALRAGFGELYQIAPWLSFLHGATRGPFGQNQFSGSSPAFTVPFAVPTGNTLADLQARTPTLFEYNIKQPKMLQYNMAVQQQLPWQMALTVAYGGSRGYNLQVLTDGNPTVPNGVPVSVNGIYVCRPGNTPPIASQNLVYGAGANACVAPIVTAAQLTATPSLLTYYPTPQTAVATRLNNSWGAFNQISDARDSWYNSLQIDLVKNLSHGFQFQTNFTYSKLLDDTQGASSGTTEVVGSATYASDPYNALLDKGPSAFNIPFSSKTNVIYHFPRVNTNRYASGLINGWWTTAIVQSQSGLPFTPTFSGSRSLLNVNNNNVAVVDRPLVVGGRNPYNITHGVSSGCQGVAAGTPIGTNTLYFDPCAFTIQSAGFLGTEERNYLSGPHFRQVDFSLVKDTHIPQLGEGGSLQFRAEIFNLFNHTNYAIPNSSVFAGSGSTVNDVETPVQGVGQILSAFPSRQVQLSLKVQF
jgi:hypothetical protein